MDDLDESPMNHKIAKYHLHCIMSAQTQTELDMCTPVSGKAKIFQKQFQESQRVCLLIHFPSGTQNRPKFVNNYFSKIAMGTCPAFSDP